MTVRLVGPPRGAGLPEIDGGGVRSRARVILAALGQARSELSVALVDDAEMRELNAAWRGKARPTDVLSFSMLEGEGAEHRRGLLKAGLELATAQAASSGGGQRSAIQDALRRWAAFSRAFFKQASLP